jgi:ribosome-associated protein
MGCHDRVRTCGDVRPLAGLPGRELSHLNWVSNAIEVTVTGEMIRLGQLLKLAGVVDDGAQARTLIEDGQVRVDGEVDRRRGRQVRPGSSVDLGETQIRVISA